MKTTRQPMLYPKSYFTTPVYFPASTESMVQVSAASNDLACDELVADKEDGKGGTSDDVGIPVAANKLVASLDGRVLGMLVQHNMVVVLAWVVATLPQEATLKKGSVVFDAAYWSRFVLEALDAFV